MTSSSITAVTSCLNNTDIQKDLKLVTHLLSHQYQCISVQNLMQSIYKDKWLKGF